MIDEREVLEMALAGYALKRADVEREIERVRLMLVSMAHESGDVADCGACRQIKREGSMQMPAEVRERMAAAQRKRWARVRREKARKGGRG